MNRYFALQKILELNSFTKAADALGYTQSNISQMIASLEDELSIKLLHRSRLGITLTLEGADLYPFIERTILQYRAMQEKAREIKGLESGSIRIGTLASVSCHWMPQLLKGFKVQYPNVQFTLHQGDYSSIQEWIKTGAVDFGFISPAAAEDLQTVVLKDGPWLAILPEDHPLTELETVPLARLAEEPFILLEEGRYNEPLEAFEQQRLTPDIRYCLHDDYAIMSMVEAGLGVSILSKLVLRRTGFRIAARPLDPPVVRTLAIGYKDRTTLPIGSKYFIAYLQKQLDQLP